MRMNVPSAIEDDADLCDRSRSWIGLFLCRQPERLVICTLELLEMARLPMATTTHIEQRTIRVLDGQNSDDGETFWRSPLAPCPPHSPSFGQRVWEADEVHSTDLRPLIEACRLRGIIEIANNEELGLEMCNGMAATMREAKSISKRCDDTSQSTKQMSSSIPLSGFVLLHSVCTSEWNNLRLNVATGWFNSLSSTQWR
jgi:hypothetical protein